MLRVENIQKHFISHVLNGKEVVGFRSVSFKVLPGMALGLSGPSGCGKSSILKCIYRTYLTGMGKIIYNSQTFGTVDLAVLPENEILALRRKEIGYVSQFLSVVPRQPAAEVVAAPLVEEGVSRAVALQRARGLLDRLNIGARLHAAYPATFSGGEKQRVNLSRAIIRPPRLLLLDEPTASLDAASMQVVLDLLLEIKARGTTIIAIFHDQAIMDRLMDDIYTMPVKES
ncbi:MAG: hypothetical protein VR64_10450 [Desulfatitalea sp. BRH_c12]|nr:MAG: hypothetical protein VR64_10450 [Desulfatitalea sp. BRH_c12]